MTLFRTTEAPRGRSWMLQCLSHTVPTIPPCHGEGMSMTGRGPPVGGTTKFPGCLLFRCRVIRMRRRRLQEAATQYEDLRNAKKELKKIIYRSKKSTWKDLRRDINNNPWGLRYKVDIREPVCLCAPYWNRIGWRIS